MLAVHVSNLTGPSSGAFYKLYSQTLVCGSTVRTTRHVQPLRSNGCIYILQDDTRSLQCQVDSTTITATDTEIRMYAINGIIICGNETTNAHKCIKKDLTLYTEYAFYMYRSLFWPSSVMCITKDILLQNFMSHGTNVRYLISFYWLIYF